MLTQQQIRQVEWSRNYLWDVQFPGVNGAPTPFNNWFPATNVETDMGVVESENFNIYTTTFSIPARTKERTLSLTFVDDANHTLIDWITVWMNLMVGYSGVLTLDRAIKMILIARLNSRRVPINAGGISYIEEYGVYPTGTIQFLGGSEDSKVNAYTVKFIIAEVGKQPYINNMVSKGVLQRS